LEQTLGAEDRDTLELDAGSHDDGLVPGSRKYSAASAVSRARNRRLRHRLIPGFVPGRRSMVDRK
jgi:hypothetical protein